MIIMNMMMNIIMMKKIVIIIIRVDIKKENFINQLKDIKDSKGKHKGALHKIINKVDLI